MCFDLRKTFGLMCAHFVDYYFEENLFLILGECFSL